MAHNWKTFTEEQVRDLRKSPWVKSATSKTIRFTAAFKTEFWRRYKEECKTPRQIVAALGFDPNMLGESRVAGIKQASNRKLTRVRMEFDTKIKIVLRGDLEMWQQLNVTAFLMSGISGTQNIIGEPYLDKDNVEYLPMSQQPIMIHSATGAQMGEMLIKAVSKDVAIAIYTEELFKTYNDEDNRAMVANYKTQELNLVGIAIRGNKNQVDRLFKGFELHK